MSTVERSAATAVTTVPELWVGVEVINRLAMQDGLMMLASWRTGINATVVDMCVDGSVRR